MSLLDASAAMRAATKIQSLFRGNQDRQALSANGVDIEKLKGMQVRDVAMIRSIYRNARQNMEEHKDSDQPDDPVSPRMSVFNRVANEVRRGTCKALIEKALVESLNEYSTKNNLKNLIASIFDSTEATDDRELFSEIEGALGNMLHDLEGSDVGSFKDLQATISELSERVCRIRRCRDELQKHYEDAQLGDDMLNAMERVRKSLAAYREDMDNLKSSLSKLYPAERASVSGEGINLEENKRTSLGALLGKLDNFDPCGAMEEEVSDMEEAYSHQIEEERAAREELQNAARREQEAREADQKRFEEQQRLEALRKEEEERLIAEEAALLAEQERVRKQQEEEKAAATIRLQSAYRGRLARLQVEERRDARKASEMEPEVDLVAQKLCLKCLSANRNGSKDSQKSGKNLVLMDISNDLRNMRTSNEKPFTKHSTYGGSTRSSGPGASMKADVTSTISRSCSIASAMSRHSSKENSAARTSSKESSDSQMSWQEEPKTLVRESKTLRQEITEEINEKITASLSSLPEVSPRSNRNSTAGFKGLFCQICGASLDELGESTREEDWTAAMLEVEEAEPIVLERKRSPGTPEVEGVADATDNEPARSPELPELNVAEDSQSVDALSDVSESPKSSKPLVDPRTSESPRRSSEESSRRNSKRRSSGSSGLLEHDAIQLKMAVQSMQSMMKPPDGWFQQQVSPNQMSRNRVPGRGLFRDESPALLAIAAQPPPPPEEPLLGPPIRRDHLYSKLYRDVSTRLNLGGRPVTFRELCERKRPTDHEKFSPRAPKILTQTTVAAAPKFMPPRRRLRPRVLSPITKMPIPQRPEPVSETQAEDEERSASRLYIVYTPTNTFAHRLHENQTRAASVLSSHQQDDVPAVSGCDSPSSAHGAIPALRQRTRRADGKTKHLNVHVCAWDAELYM